MCGYVQEVCVCKMKKDVSHNGVMQTTDEPQDVIMITKPYKFKPLDNPLNQIDNNVKIAALAAEVCLVKTLRFSWLWIIWLHLTIQSFSKHHIDAVDGSKDKGKFGG